MKKTSQIISIHLGVLVLYTLIFAILMGGSDAGHNRPDPYKWIGFMFLQAMMMCGHGLSIIILAFLQPADKPDYAKGHWLSLLFILLLGGSLCFALPAIFAN